MSTIAIARNPAYDLLLEKDRHSENLIRQLSTLDDIKAALGKRHDEGLPVPDRPRAINRFNVFCQQEKEKSIEKETLVQLASFDKDTGIGEIAGEQTVASGLTTQILVAKYRNLTEIEAETLDAKVVSLSNIRRMESRVNSGLTVRESLAIFRIYIDTLNSLYGYEVACVFGRAKSWRILSVGENVGSMDLERWKKEAYLHVNPKPFEKVPIHPSVVIFNQRVSQAKEALRNSINEQCQTTRDTVPWKHMVKIEDLRGKVLTGNNVIVENCPLDNCDHKSFMKRANFVKVEANLSQLKFKLPRHYDREFDMDIDSS
ncbi:uncharacterized protein EV154DRAFT_484577 [Mucor mucedo]|uniref:uncharacterized protein n=1 Tax=Mucor mucedo TaxID=29922 RepID=UPI00222071B1|nr:uncharacterized protein EV154DRAFT_484577 [Mucor mucedo]KAI7887933.1 hypothetical protein EV154DRAFT_484577 [Mucor mucedo]